MLRQARGAGGAGGAENKTYPNSIRTCPMALSSEPLTSGDRH
ncbi:MAG: hypothetical protein QNJ72_03725 [Pleurocapsa sp. MO_226.B13]|nr:hypothetical protein [Pleurocapsa sp. MO_226.B13]